MTRFLGRRIGLGCAGILVFWAAGSRAAERAGEANWIWSPEHRQSQVPQTACHFRKTFKLSGVEHGEIAIAADDTYELYVNGRRVGSGESTDKLDRYDISKLLSKGNNLISVKVVNTQGGTAALAARVVVREDEQHTLNYSTDDSWVTSLRPLPFWYTPLYNDSRWSEAQSWGLLGRTPPWDEVSASPTLADRGPAPADAAEPAPVAAAGPTPADSAEPLLARADESEAAITRAPSAEASPSQPATQEERGFRAAPSFQVDQVLDGAATGSLTAMVFDEFGHVVAARENGPLLLIHGSDGRHPLDQVRVYSDVVSGCQGILCLNGDVYVTAEGPEGSALYRLRDKNRDGRLEEVTALVRFEREAEEFGPHGIALGTDGYLYVAVGSLGRSQAPADEQAPYRRPLEGDLVQPRYEEPQAKTPAAKAPGGTILRVDLNGQRVQTVAGGLRNAYDLAFNSLGDLFTYDNELEYDLGTPWYRPSTLYHVPAGAEFGWRSGWAKWPDHFVDRLPPVLETGRGAPTGIVCYQHRAFPEEYRGALFVGDWGGGRIWCVRLKANGASYSASHEVFLEGDSLTITDLAVGPDGGLYFVTGGRGTRGGLYRVTWSGPEPPDAANLGQALSQVIHQPQLDAAWSRQAVAATKAQMGRDWDRLVPGVAASSTNPWQYRTRALDLMQLYGPTPTPEFLVPLARTGNERVRAKVAELMGLHPGPETGEALVALLDDSDRLVRRKACEALLRAGQPAPVDRLLPLLKSDDRYEAWAARLVLERIPPQQWRERLLEDGDHRWLIQGSLALLAADPAKESVVQILGRIEQAMGGFVSDRDFIDLLRVTELALLIGAVTPDEVPRLRELLAEEFPSSDARMNRELVRLLTYLQVSSILDRYLVYLDSSEASEVEKLHLAMHLRFLQTAWQPSQRLRVLEYVEREGKRRAGPGHAAYLSAFTRQFAAGMSDEEIRQVLVEGARWPDAALSLFYRMPEKLDQPTLEALQQLDATLLQSNEPDVLRLKVGVVAVLARSGGTEPLAYLRSLWQQDPERRLAIAMGLAQWPTEENWHFLVRSLPILEGGAAHEVLGKLLTVKLAPEEPEFYRHVILRGLQLDDKGAALAVDLLELWAGEEMPGDKPADQLAAWQQWYAQQWPDQPPATLPAYRVSGKWEFRELARYLTSGDGRYGSAERGAEVFQQAQCAGCHRRGATGDGAAPDLSTLPRRSMKKETLESILFPSHSLPERFAEQTVILGDGRILAGKLLPQEDSGQVLLVEATGRVLALEQAAIEEIVADHLSPMPEGLLDPFDLQQIADLFAYLHQTGEPRIAQQPQPTAVE